MVIVSGRMKLIDGADARLSDQGLDLGFPTSGSMFLKRFGDRDDFAG